MTIHLAARETFAIEGIPACRGSRRFLNETLVGFEATHTLAKVTCKTCRKTAEFKRAEALGLTDNDETWGETPLTV